MYNFKFHDRQDNQGRFYRHKLPFIKLRFLETDKIIDCHIKIIGNVYELSG